MGEWVANPHTKSALSDVLPCVDQKTTNKTLIQSKQVVTNIASVINQFIYNTANLNSTLGSLGYYNQSGPKMPPLCYPFDSQLQERQCTDQEVSSANASMGINVDLGRGRRRRSEIKSVFYDEGVGIDLGECLEVNPR
ncbi:hypothetical protein Fmac_016537 [Flemingia macrophylla]|uniref:Uncharacterized protein n=1 Tax=Flemingia macrophylla TaxID=520843 RepID=A0ABD1MHP2_9FABA